MTFVILTTDHNGKPAGERVKLKPELARRLAYLGHARIVPEPTDSKPVKAIAKEAAE